MKRAMIAMALALALDCAASGQEIRPSKQDIAEVVGDTVHRSYPDEQLVAWDADLRKALRRGTVENAADTLSAKYGISAPDMRRLASVWIIARARKYDGDISWKSAAHTALLALIPNVRQSPVGLPALAETLDAMDLCTAENFDALMVGSTDRAGDAFRIANAATCGGYFGLAAAASADRAMPALIRMAQWGSLPLQETIPLYAWLTSETALAHVSEADRPLAATLLYRLYLTDLFRADLHQRALAILDGLPADLRASILSPAFVLPSRLTVNGVVMTFAEDDRQAMPLLEVAQALAIDGREDEARRLLGTLPGLRAARAAAACLYARVDDKAPSCPTTHELPMKALVLDDLLNNPQADPYTVAEVVLSDGNHGGSIAEMRIQCRLFAAKDYPELCKSAAAADLTEMTSPADEVARDVASLEKALPGFAEIRAAFLAGIEERPASSRHEPRKTVVAVPPPFAAHPVPTHLQEAAKAASTKGLAPLPEGFFPVRVERTGQRVIAISVSQLYDPTGEISPGGYWVHLSEDGGKHWQAPLYTGLADRFPYVVKPSSRLPLIDGDTLNVAVDIAEIDTASISYPPVGLRTRRRAGGLYLAIPLADLRRDSDGDGLTDIAARHLLLDRAPAARPFVVGSDRGVGCPATVPAERSALIGLLSRLIAPSEEAIIEPVDRPNEDFMSGWMRTGAARDQPLFLLGDRQDFLCLNSKRPIIVYSKDDIAALERFTPVFHPFDMPRIIFNRARDRGYALWSTGWAGGTFRLRLVNSKWVFDSISEWIT